MWLVDAQSIHRFPVDLIGQTRATRHFPPKHLRADGEGYTARRSQGDRRPCQTPSVITSRKGSATVVQESGNRAAAARSRLTILSRLRDDIDHNVRRHPVHSSFVFAWNHNLRPIPWEAQLGSTTSLEFHNISRDSIAVNATSCAFRAKWRCPTSKRQRRR